MSGKAVGYIRVSSVDQNDQRQLEGVDLDQVFSEKMSGASASSRTALQSCLRYLRDGDTLHVHSIDRLARNMIELQSMVDELVGRGVSVVFHKEQLRFSAGADDAMQRLMLQMMGSFAEFERSMIKERQREGIAAAKRAGKHLGRKAALSDVQVAELRKAKAAGESAPALAKRYGVSRATVYEYLKGG
jgi:DNA invertase Pin-like site-specific DNA recombinase